MHHLWSNSSAGFKLKAGRAESLLAGCLRGPDAETRAELGQLAEAGWGALLRAAARHGVSPLLYERLSSPAGSETKAPAGVVAALREAFLMNGARNELLFQDLARVLRALRGDGLGVVVLKGGHLAELVYAQRALRKMADIDLLVRRGDLARAAARLSELGYSWETENLGTWLAPGLAASHLQPFSKPPHPRIEVHWTINTFRPVPMEGVWGRVRPATLAGVDALVLSPGDLVLHLCLHADQHWFRTGLRLLCDLSATLERYGGEIDWDCVVSSAREAQAEKCVYLALRLARELVRAPVPGVVLQALEPRNAGKWLALAAATVLAGEDDLAPETAKAVGPLQVFARVPGSGSIGSRMKSVWRSVFPSREHMREYMAAAHSLPLTRLRSYICYVTRGCDWLGRGFRVARHWVQHRTVTAEYVRKQIRNRRLRAWLEGGRRGRS